MAISITTQRRLFADSGGFCANPICPSPYLFRELDLAEPPTIAEMAHVIAQSRAGPRGEEPLRDEERDLFENLVLLCANCHKVVDDMKALGRYSVELMRRWKAEHGRRVRESFEAPEVGDRDELVRQVARLLRENGAVWEQYGPESDAADRLTSDVAEVWRREARDQILPNNRKILALIDRNERLLQSDELDVVERFRVHARAFARTQLGDPQVGAPRFPAEMREIFPT
jgi:hypothetical protein